jgi:hypothetical protein
MFRMRSMSISKQDDSRREVAARVIYGARVG